MYHVYLLKSLKNPTKSYVGFTNRDIKIRLSEHNNGMSSSTKTDLPWELIYYESFSCQNCAEKREKFLKSGFGYRLRKLLLDNYKELR